MQRLMKFLHTLGAIGLTGALAAYIILLATSPDLSDLEAYAAVRHGIERVATWLLMPSLLVALTSGLLAIALHRPYMGARWAWLKAFLGVSMFEGALVGVVGPAEQAAEVTARAVAGEIDAARVPELMHDEWNTLWFILALALVNVALATWRPRLRRRAAAD